MDQKRCYYHYKIAQTFGQNFWSLNICLALMVICLWPHFMFTFMISNLHSGYRYHFLNTQNWIFNSFSLHSHRMYFIQIFNYFFTIQFFLILFSILQMLFAVITGGCYIVETQTKIWYVSKKTGWLFDFLLMFMCYYLYYIFMN